MEYYMLVENSIEIALKYGLEYLSEDIKNNKEFALRFLDIAIESPLDKIKPFELNSFSAELRDDPDIVNSYFDFICREVSKKEEWERKQPLVIDGISVFYLGVPQMWDNKTSCLKFASLNLRDNKEFVMPILTRIGMDIEYVSDRLKEDEDVVLASFSHQKTSFSIGGKEDKNKLSFYTKDSLYDSPIFLKKDFIIKLCSITNSLVIFDYLPRETIDILIEKNIFDDLEMKALYNRRRDSLLKLRSKIWNDRLQTRWNWNESWQEWYPYRSDCYIFKTDKDIAEVLVLGAGALIFYFVQDIREDAEICALARYEYSHNPYINIPISHTKNWRFFENREVYFNHIRDWVKIEDTSKDLYIIQSKGIGTIKIGVAQDCNARLKQLQTANPYELKLVHVFKGMGHLEKYLHKELVEYRQQGEWFSYDCIEHIPKVLLNLMPEDALDHWWKN